MWGAQNKQNAQQQQYQIKLNLLNHMKDYFQKQFYKKISRSFMNTFSQIGKDDQDRVRFTEIFKKMLDQKNFNPSLLKLSTKQSRGIASLLGLGICDALGASTQFQDFSFQNKGLITQGFSDIHRLIDQKKLRARHGQVGIWTDDASMALAMGNSLLHNDFKFDPIHIRYMFILWLDHGLGNGGRDYSIGLGGNISISIDQFMRRQQPFCQQGQQNNSGNGSLMRLAPIPLAQLDNRLRAIQNSGLQSLTTHNGLQARQCAKLLAAIIVDLVNRKDNEEWRDVLSRTCQQFKSQIQCVEYLAHSKAQTKQMFNDSAKKQRSFLTFNKKPEDRNWNWKSIDHTYSPYRAYNQPGYVGSYCMDALAMALHTVWHTKSFKECATFNASIGGDCDTVGAIAGQIAGAAYGIDQGMLKLYSQMVDFSTHRFQVFLMGYKIVNRKSIHYKQAHQHVQFEQTKQTKSQSMEVQKINQTQNTKQTQEIISQKTEKIEQLKSSEMEIEKIQE